MIIGPIFIEVFPNGRMYAHSISMSKSISVIK